MGHVDAVKLLLSHGADPNLQDVGGHTSLHLAMLNTELDADVTQALVTAGADVNLRNFEVGCGALLLAFDSPSL